MAGFRASRDPPLKGSALYFGGLERAFRYSDRGTFLVHSVRIHRRPAGLQTATATENLSDLIARYDGRLRRYLSRALNPADAEDALHDVYARLARQANRVPPPVFNSTYVFKTADGVLFDLYRRQRSRSAGQHIELSDDIAAETPTPFDLMRWKQNVTLLQSAIRSLPREERLVLMLHRIEGQKLTDIAQTQRIPLRSVQRLLAQALARCRVKLKDSGWYEL